MLVAVIFTYDKYLVSIPDTSKYKPLELQKLFDKWLFDERVDHEYWVYTYGKKDYVSYDIEAFIKWLNENIFANSDEEVKIVERNISNIPMDLEKLYF